jgi:hypothetical protein
MVPNILEWRKVFCDEICEFQEWHSTELRKHSKKDLKGECEKHEHVSCLTIYACFGREAEKV